MPLKYFRHPLTKEKLDIDRCIKEGLLSEFFPLSYLKLCAKQRVWKGTPSTTQLIQGTRKAYLEILCDYTENPDDSIFKVLGTRVHKNLELSTPKQSFAELSIPDLDINMTADLLEQQAGGEWWLIDYKTVGAYTIKRCLGLEKHKRPAMDENGNYIRYKKSGKWGTAGDIKQESYFVQNSKKADFGEWPLQLNRYRMEIERFFDITIPRIKIFAIPRETDNATIARYGIEKKTYYFDLPIIENEAIEEYFSTKKKQLLDCLEKYDNLKQEGCDLPLVVAAPPQCSYVESWEGRKCESYCNVAEFCRNIGCTYLGET